MLTGVIEMRAARWGYHGKVVVVLLGLLLVMPTAASAATTSLSVSAPGAVLSGQKVVVHGRASLAGASVVLQSKKHRHWATLDRKRLRKHHPRFALGWHTPHRAGVVLIRVRALRGRKVLASSSPLRVVVSTGHFAPGKTAVVARPASALSLPAPGKSGNLTLAGSVNIKPGQVLALGYSLDTPFGFLGRVIAVTQENGQTVLETVPATLQQAGAQGTLDLSTFHKVGPDGQPARSPIGRSAVSANGGVFNPDFGKGFSCSGSASASLTGRVSMSVTPALHAHFSLFSGLTSADFTLTGAASASLTAAADASGVCQLARTELLGTPLHIATFVGTVGIIPVVVVLQGQLFIDASISSKARVCTSVHASASVTGGVGWDDNNGFHPIFNGPSANFGFDPPGLSTSVDASANVEPALQMLLYDVGGPQLGLTAGLAFQADPNVNPWWTLTAPLSIDASLTAPSLNLDSGNLNLYQHTFPVADSGGPFPIYVPPSPC